MGVVYLVRHGQASLGAADYDRLAERGQVQAQRLGAYWQARGRCFDAVYTGTLQRHAQTLAGIVAALPDLPPACVRPELDEYDSAALIRAIHPGPLARVDTPERARAHFRLLCDALAQWMAGTISPEGMPDWDDFASGVRTLLDEVRRTHADGQVLVVSSGGPIATAVAQVLGVTPEVGIALNMRLRNSSVSELSVSPRRMMLQTFNTLAHLSAPGDEALVTYA
ncbi:MAG: histidine phosphatase family protein [Comamonadaceae bacterium]|nr:histidine phosphatase family protein [Burkholderiales bacterium]MEB2348501.1 histidine phosphatase family protein [Comamonadaceae bacterium]